ncbi:hypothetical protein MNB_SM-7-1333 [hydrothermal vent metagenome]|uniref:Uncharacterized protein n=1 Tax=hydrothermal vent metagenome TaxID=652676 RepID=A0A1W1BXY0_9ZZZZ
MERESKSDEVRIYRTYKDRNGKIAFIEFYKPHRTNSTILSYKSFIKRYGKEIIEEFTK